MQREPLVALRGVSKRFGATQALDDVSLELLGGEVHALVGENGAGKSTLVKILAGIYQPDSGTVLLDGSPTELRGAAQARSLGIAVVHQEPRLFPDLTVAENVFVGHAPGGRLGSIDWAAMRRSATGIFAGLGVRMDPGALVRGLSMADQQLIEIAKALSIEARVLVLDEPTASLSAHEVERLFAIVRQTRDRGVAVLFVSHRLEEVFELCDRATVFRDGRHVITARTAELTTAALVRHMVGRAVSLFPKVESPIGDVILEVRGLSRRRRLPRRVVLGPPRRDRGLRRPGRRRPHGGGAGDLRRRPPGFRAGRPGGVAGRRSRRRPRRCTPGSPTSRRTVIRTAWSSTSPLPRISPCRSCRASFRASSCAAAPSAPWHAGTWSS